KLLRNCAHGSTSRACCPGTVCTDTVPGRLSGISCAIADAPATKDIRSVERIRVRSRRWVMEAASCGNSYCAPESPKCSFRFVKFSSAQLRSPVGQNCLLLVRVLSRSIDGRYLSKEFQPPAKHALDEDKVSCSQHHADAQKTRPT